MLGVLLMSFGGPNGPDDVRPFLLNVAAGRRIPPARLDEVAEHYLAFGGVSPINQLNAELVAALQGELDRRGVAALVTVGNRNWEPYFPEALACLLAAGCSEIVLLPSSAYEAYSTCRQYVEDFEKARAALLEQGHDFGGVVIHQAVPIWRWGEFVALQTDIVRAASLDDSVHVVFVTHSIPNSMDAASGTGLVYSAQTRWVCEQVMRKLGQAVQGWSLAYCSRSGPPHVPWLEPDICDHLAQLKGQGVEKVLVVPVGFVNDHMEVVFDLDTEAAEVADELGLGFERAATAGVLPGFVSALVDSVLQPGLVATDCCHDK